MLLYHFAALQSIPAMWDTLDTMAAEIDDDVSQAAAAAVVDLIGSAG